MDALFAWKTEFPILLPGEIDRTRDFNRDSSQRAERKTTEFIASPSLAKSRNLVTYRLLSRMHENFAQPPRAPFHPSSRSSPRRDSTSRALFRGARSLHRRTGNELQGRYHAATITRTLEVCSLSSQRVSIEDKNTLCASKTLVCSFPFLRGCITFDSILNDFRNIFSLGIHLRDASNTPCAIPSCMWSSAMNKRTINYSRELCVSVKSLRVAERRDQPRETLNATR